MPPTRREQLELDELLSDIYRGIETFPDKSAQVNNNINHHQNNHNSPTLVSSNKSSNNLYSRSYLKEYELTASSPLVKQHKQELSNLRSNANPTSQSIDSKQPQRSTLKRHTNTPDQSMRQPQSLASFVTSTTPENKRRVRIVDHPDKVAKGFSSSDNYEAKLVGIERKPTNVKYVNTNKLIYHQERNPDDEILSDANSDENNSLEGNENDDIDGVSRVEYYHTTWLDRQLGRASKRRSSKELNERQVKEKAMIEELKRSLKNGAITLRQSLKGKKKNTNKPSETYDDQMLDPGNKVKKSTVFGSGLATIPRNYQINNKNSNYTRKNSKLSNELSANEQEQQISYKECSSNTLATPKQTVITSDYTKTKTNTTNNNFNSTCQPMLVRHQEPQSNYSRTLPHNYQQQSKKSEHQLLQSHYRGDKNFNTINSSCQENSNSDKMRNLHYSDNCSPKTYGVAKNSTKNQIDHDVSQQQQQHQQPQYHQPGNTISSIPSATEVVRSALSRSGSQVSLNLLNKTINLLPNSPPPYVPSPMTPTQQLKPTSPSLSPSPVSRSPYQRRNSDLVNCYQSAPNTHFMSKTMEASDRKQAQQQHQPSLQGGRTVGRAPQKFEQQPVYANPHASLMQHRIEQQMNKPGKNNVSIREFNELDSLLRSLSPGSTQIVPSYTSKPSQPFFGYGCTPGQQLGTPKNQPRPNMNNSSDVYAKVQKQSMSNYQIPKEQTKASYLQQHYGVNNNIATHQQFTIDVTNKKDENCLQRQDLSEFEPPGELLPSMEDYQNISKLNPVKNHYWYKPNMSRDRAINLLKDKPQGTFIVRDSTSFKGAYGLAVKVSKLPKNVLNNASLRNPYGDPSAELIRHFLIEPTSNGVRLKGYANEPVFGSLPALIYQHSLTELALPCKLVIPRADIEDSKFNQKQKQFYDEFLASKEQAKHSPYDRTSPNGGYRKYPGDVYVHNEHRIIFE